MTGASDVEDGEERREEEGRGGERSRDRLPGVLAKCGATKNRGKKIHERQN